LDIYGNSFFMQDVSKVEGPSGPPESFGKKDKGSVDADKFKEAMRRRVTEVSQIDPDEQKKRKRREEAEEEEPLKEAPEEPTTSPSQVAPFSLEEEPKKVSPLEMQGKGISPTESAQKAAMPSPPLPAFFQTPSTDEMTDDSGMLEEESFIETIPTSPEKAAPPPTFGEAEAPPVLPSPPEQPVAQAPFQPPPSAQPPPTQGMAPPTEQPAVTGKPETETGRQPPKKKPIPSPAGPPPEKKPKISGIEPKLAPGLKTEQQKQAGPLKPSPVEKGTTAAEMEGVVPSKAETAGFFEQLGKGGEGEKEGKKPPKTPEELEKEAEVQGAAAVTGSHAPFAPSLERKEEKKVEEKEVPPPIEMGAGIPATPGELAGTAMPALTPEALPSYANLHPQVMEIFDRMVGVMTVMNMSGMTETTITLNAPQFASSVFFGTQIIIQEFSTAPQAFNIQLNGTPQAVALFQGNVDDLMAAFQAGNYNFRVNRLETGYLTERPLFKRKEKAGDKEKDTGESQR
jgi:hypothetical protein